MLRCGGRSGFTLLEMVVSIMIFSVVSLAMVTVLKLSVDIFRSGERARQSSDEGIAILSAIDDDLRRVLPASAGGFFYARNADWVNDKPSAMAWEMVNPNADEIGVDGQAARIIVVWWQDNLDKIHRSTFAAPESNSRVSVPTGYSGSIPTPTVTEDYWNMVKRIYLAASTLTPDTTIVAEGCLHLGCDLETPSDRRDALAWTTGGNPLPPVAGADFRSGTSVPMPSAVRLTLIFSGGRHGIRGRLVKKLDVGDSQARISGVANPPMGDEALVRIGDPNNPEATKRVVEWISYDGFKAGNLLNLGRGKLKTSEMAHDPGDIDSPVSFGRRFSMVRRIE